jgi:hypothetical protein
MFFVFNTLFTEHLSTLFQPRQVYYSRTAFESEVLVTVAALHEEWQQILAVMRQGSMFDFQGSVCHLNSFLQDVKEFCLVSARFVRNSRKIDYYSPETACAQGVNFPVTV